MKVLTLLRLMIWSLVLAICIVVVTSNYIVSQTILDKHNLQTAAKKGNVYSTVRNQLLAPHILATAKESDYAALVDAKLVNESAAKVFDDATLEKLFSPAVDSLSAWLNSKQPDASFTIDAHEQMERLSTTLTDKVVTRIMALPDCTYRNSLKDIENGVCKSVYVTEDELRQEIIASLRTNSVIRDGEITAEQLTLPESLISRTRNIPEFINMLYSVAIFAAGIFALVSLRLLFKHRLIGIATIGISGLLASGILFVVVQSFASYMASIALEPAYETVAQSITQLVADETKQTVARLSAISMALVLVGIGLWFFTKRRQKDKRHTVHLEETRDQTGDED